MCGISISAAESVRRYSSWHEVFWVDVLEQRELSNWIAETLRVRHESPQLIELKDGLVQGVWSHSAIRAKLDDERGSFGRQQADADREPG